MSQENFFLVNEIHSYEWPNKTQKRLPDLFLERKESETQRATDAKHDENVTVNSDFNLQMFK